MVSKRAREWARATQDRRRRRKKDAVDGPLVGLGYWFHMTADTQGSQIGYYNELMGSIDREPLVGVSGISLLYALRQNAGGGLSFAGDCLSLVQGRTLYIDGVAMLNPDTPFTVIGGGAQTVLFWNSGAPFTFVNGVTYLIDLRA